MHNCDAQKNPFKNKDLKKFTLGKKQIFILFFCVAFFVNNY